MEASVQSWPSPCEICGGQSGTRTGFSLNTFVFYCHYCSMNAPCSFVHLLLTMISPVKITTYLKRDKDTDGGESLTSCSHFFYFGGGGGERRRSTACSPPSCWLGGHMCLRASMNTAEDSLPILAIECLLVIKHSLVIVACWLSWLLTLSK